MTETPIISNTALEAEIVGEIAVIVEWLREPDHAEAFSLSDVTGWMDRRPLTAAHTAAKHARALLARIEAGEKVDETRLEVERQQARSLIPNQPQVLQDAFADIAENAIRRYFAFKPREADL